MNEISQPLTILTAFMAGLLSFFTPCVLPLIPSYISYITGITFADLTRETLPKRIRVITAIHSLLFIAGFTVVFVLLGLSFNLLSGFFLKNSWILKKIGGAIVILFGLNIVGVLKLNFLQREKKVEMKTKPLGYLGSFLMGATFSLGWTPCVGPILSSILILGSTSMEASKAALLLFSYSMGLGLPFFVSGALINNFLAYFKSIKKYLKTISIISGLFIVIIGVMIFMGGRGMTQ
ncbi:MAG: cytochrome c biogenesis protein CcdA [Candidatus Omnitrophota bacterium]